MRIDQRQPHQLRTIEFKLNPFHENTLHSASTGLPANLIAGFSTQTSILASCGNTKVLCAITAIYDPKQVPEHARIENKGWLTAEYGMLPTATKQRQIRTGKQNANGRTQEIQRLIGRSLRACIDLRQLPGWLFIVDCDVLIADGGTRVTAINGAYVALTQAIADLLSLNFLLQPENQTSTTPAIITPIAAVSVGYFANQTSGWHYLLDLNYPEDAQADVDLNVVMNAQGNLIEIQACAEGQSFNQQQLNEMLNMAHAGIMDILALQCDFLRSMA